MTVPAFKLTPERVPERDIQEACADALDKLLLPPAFWFSAAIGATTLSAQQAAALTPRAGVKRGLPDLWILYRGTYCIELKGEGGRLSTTRIIRTPRGTPRVLLGQEEVFPMLVRSGGVKDIKIAHSVNEMLEVLERWEIPLRSHHR